MTPNPAHQSPLAGDHRSPIRAATARWKPNAGALVIPLRHMNGHGIPKVSLQGISLSYKTNDGSQMLALDNINLSVRPGEFLCIVGPSGCGKSTLLHLIAGLHSGTAGRVLVDDKTVAGPGTD